MAAGSEPQWLSQHRAAAEAIALDRHGRRLRPVAAHGPLLPSGLDLGEGDYDVAEPDLGLLEPLGPDPVAEDGPTGCGCFG